VRSFNDTSAYRRFRCGGGGPAVGSGVAGQRGGMAPPRPRATGGQWAGLDVAVLLDGAQGKTLEDAARGRRRRVPREEEEEEGRCTGKNLKEEGCSTGGRPGRTLGQSKLWLKQFVCQDEPVPSTNLSFDASCSFSGPVGQPKTLSNEKISRLVGQPKTLSNKLRYFTILY
jgi:hypothetical protein